jgi:hypothetical protein
MGGPRSPNGSPEVCMNKLKIAKVGKWKIVKNKMARRVKTAILAYTCCKT